eukprot:CAMPEP_0195295564 /NCGR_PEP_ID=MMETSP0707-20130614/17624_1 /TAXON_ID=33640 /ORGANISM="Asterionellopsis glacialis, Strain CCMP134" /LENGTH=222 /DNA_ID=CAMNT_0040356813 /DNA_START=117 /DNA_END=785 /DNA_ORIENTATION=-
MATPNCSIVPKTKMIAIVITILVLVIGYPLQAVEGAFVGLPTDPALVNVAIGIVSAAAGAVSQVPQIQKLQQQLDSEKTALEETQKARKVEAIHSADQLYVMDEEFEQQTLQLKHHYETQLQEEIGKITEKLQQEYKFTYGIQLYREKQKLEMEKLQCLGTINGRKDMDLVQLRLQRNQLERHIEQLENTLGEQRQALEEFQQQQQQQQAPNRTNSQWWLFP